MSAAHRSLAQRRALVAGLAVTLAAWVGCGDGGSSTPPADPAVEAAHLAEVEAWRAERVGRLQAEDGWLSLVGLYWLAPGENAFGGDPQLPVPLPADAAPPRAGVLHYDGAQVRLVADPGVELTVNDEATREAVLRDDAAGEADIVRLGRLRFYVLARDGRHAIRVKDPQGPARAAFHGLEYFPVAAAHSVVGRFSPLSEPREVEVPTVAGTYAKMLVPGEVAFEWEGQSLSLLPLVSDPDETELFFIIKDETSGKETYPAGRYLYGTLEGDEVVLDFDKAYNPPCAFTEFATCPLPPRENRLAVALTAGEKSYGSH